MPRIVASEICDAVRTLQTQGKSLREISRLLHLSRNTVRRLLRATAPPAPAPPPCDASTRALIENAFARAGDNVVRVRELLAEEHALAVSYSTLTRWVREIGLRTPPRRAGEYHFTAGEEMQHDTSPHQAIIAGKTRKVQCASLVLAYSRRLFIQYFPHFSRFEAKQFLLEAARFNDGVCPRCIVDNTSVIVVAGTGKQAIFAPEMVAFARTLGFAFAAHERGDPNRKGRVERPFSYAESNFLAARSFRDFDDLNAQARHWCCEVANAKPKRVLRMSAEAAYVIEKPSLLPLPAALPPVYELLERVADLHGYVSVDTNRYSVPERFVGRPLTVYKYPAEIQIHHRGSLIASHPRLLGQRDGRHILPGHHLARSRPPRAPAVTEKLLADTAQPSLERYAAALRQHAGSGATRALRRLLELKRTYPSAPFLAAVEQALHFGLFDLGRLEGLILKQVAGDFFALDHDADDDT